jgi:hypothetical protein
MATARGRAGAEGGVLLRVRLARDRSGVDVLPLQQAGPAAPVATLAQRPAGAQA